VLKDAPPFLRPGGALLFEIGLGQERQIELLFKRAGRYEDIRLWTDAGGSPRVASGRNKG
jgi:release factor glutamine methyltransferase